MIPYDSKRINELTDKYLEGSLTDSERQELESFISSSEQRRKVFELNTDPIWREKQLAVFLKAEEVQPIRFQEFRRRIFWQRWRPLMAAAAIFMMIAAGGFVWLQPIWKFSHVQRPANASASDLLPGGTKATLTLASGQQIILDQVKEGQIASENGTKISKLPEGILRYLTNKKLIKPQEQTSYNILTVPKGGTYQLVLPDQSSVYLNSGSSLKYPTSFDPLTPRTVELTGEAFFMIKKDHARPFKVNIAGKIIDVLGTSFDVNGYSDEPYFTTTLLEGSVKVSNGLDQSLTLKPGQQVVGLNGNHGGQNMQIVNDIDTDGIIAWKTGHFHFENAPIQTVMRQLSRWYDIDVSYQGPVTKELFNGNIQRNLKFAQVAEILGDYVHFKIEDKKVIVEP